MLVSGIVSGPDPFSATCQNFVDAWRGCIDSNGSVAKLWLCVLICLFIGLPCLRHAVVSPTVSVFWTLRLARRTPAARAFVICRKLAGGRKSLQHLVPARHSTRHPNSLPYSKRLPPVSVVPEPARGQNPQPADGQPRQGQSFIAGAAHQAAATPG